MEAKHTKGEWLVTGTPKTFVYALSENGVNLFSASIQNDNHLLKTEELEANAMLIVESANVANETGLTPRELVAQRDELREALQDLLGWANISDNSSSRDLRDRIQLLISKTTQP
jgi:hypothetical protein